MASDADSSNSSHSLDSGGSSFDLSALARVQELVLVQCLEFQYCRHCQEDPHMLLLESCSLMMLPSLFVVTIFLYLFQEDVDDFCEKWLMIQLCFLFYRPQGQSW